jgi:hypothetical protein
VAPGASSASNRRHCPSASVSAAARRFPWRSLATWSDGESREGRLAFTAFEWNASHGQVDGEGRVRQADDPFPLLERRRRLAARHEVVAITVDDPREHRLPDAVQRLRTTERGDLDVQVRRWPLPLWPHLYWEVLSGPGGSVLNLQVIAEGIETPEQIEVRIMTAAREMELWRDYRYTIISKSMEEDLQKFRNIMGAERYLSRRLALS